MELHSITLVSKNNVKNGFYLYTGIAVDNEGEYWHAVLPLFKKPVKKDDVKEFKPTRKVKPEFYAANNISKNNLN